MRCISAEKYISEEFLTRKHDQYHVIDKFGFTVRCQVMFLRVVQIIVYGKNVLISNTMRHSKMNDALILDEEIERFRLLMHIFIVIPFEG